MKLYKWIILVLIGCCILFFACRFKAPIVAGEWTKQTIYLWLINCFQRQPNNIETRVLLIDDDSGPGIFKIKQICDQLEMKASFAIIPYGMCTQIRDSLLQWQQKGYGIALHGYRHEDWREWDYKEVINDIIQGETWLSNNGFNCEKVKIVVPPHGGNSRAIREAIKAKGYQMITGANILNKDPHTFQLGRVMITKDTDLEETKVWLKKAKERKLFVVLGTHSSIPDEFSTEKTRAVLSMAKDMGFEFDY